MRKLMGAGLLVGAMLGSPAFAQASPVVGTWVMQVQTPGRSFEVAMTVSGAGGSYTVAFEAPSEGEGDGPAMEEQISNVVVDGSSLSFTRTLSTPENPIVVSYDLEVDGDALSGEARSAFGAVPIAATRR